MLFKDFVEVARGNILIKRPGMDEIIEYGSEYIGVFDNRKVGSIDNKDGEYIVTLEDTEYKVKLKHLRHILGLNNGYGQKENFNVWIYEPKDGKQYAFNYGVLYRFGERFVDRIIINTDSWDDKYLEVLLKEER